MWGSHHIILKLSVLQNNKFSKHKTQIIEYKPSNKKSKMLTRPAPSASEEKKPRFTTKYTKHGFYSIKTQDDFEVPKNEILFLFS